MLEIIIGFFIIGGMFVAICGLCIWIDTTFIEPLRRRRWLKRIDRR